MPSKFPFRFQHFTVRDDRTAMKVGTDGVLLGAWTPIRNAQRILDIGTGCGIVALMIAQRTTALSSHVSAIDIDADAAEQACENFQASPWPNRLPRTANDIHMSLDQLSNRKCFAFDLIVSNPPFFSDSSRSPDSARTNARHTEVLSRDSLFEVTKNLLAKHGRLCLILPFDQTAQATEKAEGNGFRLWSQMNVRPNPESKLKRVLLEFCLGGLPGNRQNAGIAELTVETRRHQYSTDYANLTREFHLRYAQ